MFDMIFTYTVVIFIMIYSILLLNYSNELIKSKLKEGDSENCRLDDNVLATQGIAVTLLFFSIICFVSTLHTYNPQFLNAIVNFGTNIPYTKYIIMCIVLSMSIYILVITNENKGCADKIGLHTSFLDFINISIISLISLYIIYKAYKQVNK